LENSKLTEHLRPGETVVWSGQPNRDKLLMRVDYIWVPLGLLIGVLSIASFVAALLTLFDGNAGAVIGLLVSMLLAALALYLVFGRFVQRRRRAAATFYAITDSRVVALDRGVVNEVGLGESIEPRLTEQFERRGVISVGKLDLWNIDNAAVVFEILSGQIAAASRS
jgi:hypothetical protein